MRYEKSEVRGKAVRPAMFLNLLELCAAFFEGPDCKKLATEIDCPSYHCWVLVRERLKTVAECFESEFVISSPKLHGIS